MPAPPAGTAQGAVQLSLCGLEFGCTSESAERVRVLTFLKMDKPHAIKDACFAGLRAGPGGEGDGERDKQSGYRQARSGGHCSGGQGLGPSSWLFCCGDRVRAAAATHISG